MSVPWENEDGSTNVDGFLAAYAEDNNDFWRADKGHIMNVVDELIDRLEAVIEAARSLLAEHRNDPGGTGEETMFGVLAETALIAAVVELDELEQPSHE